MNSIPVEDDEFRRYADRISERLEFHGAWFFQLKRDEDGRLYLLEVCPRISGTMATFRVVGVNFPLLTILEHERVEVVVAPEEFNVEIDRALVNRYRHDLVYERIYVDLDDTLVLDGEVNNELARFLFQCINRGCHVALLSRSAGDVEAVLAEHRLAGLFDEVIQIGPTESKAAHIDPAGAIFIDDSFSERMDVRSRLRIPTFDLSMLELLLDDRV
jgi:hypothetical protein